MRIYGDDEGVNDGTWKAFLGIRMKQRAEEGRDEWDCE